MIIPDYNEIRTGDKPVRIYNLIFIYVKSDNIKAMNFLLGYWMARKSFIAFTVESKQSE